MEDDDREVLTNAMTPGGQFGQTRPSDNPCEPASTEMTPRRKSIENDMTTAQNRGRAGSHGTVPPHVHEPPPLLWQTEPFHQVLKRERSKRKPASGSALPTSILVSARHDLEIPGESDAPMWESRAWKPDDHRRARGVSGTRVTTFARRLMAIERFRARRRRPEEFLGR